MNEEAIGDLVADSAHLSRVQSISLLANTLSTGQNFIRPTVGTAGSVSSSLSASWADSTDSTDSTETLEARTFVSIRVVLLIGSAFSGANAILVREETSVAVTVVGGLVVLRVDWASHTVSVADKIVSRAFLTNVAHESETIKTLALSSLDVVH